MRCEPLISGREFDRIGRRMASRAHRKGVPSTKDQAMLTSVIKCSQCGRNVSWGRLNGILVSASTCWQRFQSTTYHVVASAMMC